MKRIFSLLLIIVLITACSGTFSKDTYTTIDSNKLKEFIDRGEIVIDVRTTEEYNDGHIKSAINVPLDSIETISYDKDTLIVVYCASGIRSAQAAQKLVDIGYTNIYNLDGGILNAGELLEE